MSYRLTRVCVVLLVFGNVLNVLTACGDDNSSSEENVATAGTSAAGRGSAGASGRGSAGNGTPRGNFGGQMCPMTEAEATGTCTPARGSCTFGERTCDCIDETMSWACWAPSECPTSVPAERSACSVVGMTCSPTNDTDCDCTAQGWDCGAQFCPAAEPALGSECEGGTGECSYGTRTCDCDNSVWVCWDPKSDCPAAPPLDRATCSLDGVVCQYEGGSCECNDTSWRCGRGVDNDPEDAGVGPGPGDNAAGAGGNAGTAAAGVSGAGTAGVSGAGTAGTAAGAGAGGSP